jgi:aspartate aminotransferase
MNISKRLAAVPPSPMRKLAPLAKQAKDRGVKVLHLNIGDPDIKTPEPMLNVLRSWKINPIGYDNSQGNPEFVNALVGYYRSLGFNYVCPEHIQVTTGGSEAISMAMFAVAEPGEEIIVFEPYYANYNSYAVVNGVKLVAVPTGIENGFHLPSQKLIEAKISKNTKAILICNPNNPTGTVYTRREMDLLVQLARKHQLYLLSDEVYRDYVYDHAKHVSILEYMANDPKQLILLDSMSKRYSLCGIRLGCLVSLNPELLDGVIRIAMGRLSCGLVDQMVAAKLSKVSRSYLEQVNHEYDVRRQILYHGLKNIPGVTIPKPEGAFYVIAGLPVDNAEKFASWLLTDFSVQGETVMITPASGFYSNFSLGTKEVRIAYVLNPRAIKRAVRIIALALKSYPGRID